MLHEVQRRSVTEPAARPEAAAPKHDARHGALKAMTFDQGERALAPVQMEEAKTAAPPKPFTAAVVNYTPGRYEEGQNKPDRVIFSGGKNRGVTVGTKVMVNGIGGCVVEVYEGRSQAVFYRPVTEPKTVEVCIGEKWSRAQEDAAQQKRDQDQAKRDEKERYTDEHKTRR